MINYNLWVSVFKKSTKLKIIGDFMKSAINGRRDINGMVELYCFMASSPKGGANRNDTGFSSGAFGYRFTDLLDVVCWQIAPELHPLSCGLLSQFADVFSVDIALINGDTIGGFTWIYCYCPPVKQARNKEFEGLFCWLHI